MARVFALCSDRLRLRKLGPEDLDALIELDSDPEVMRYINDGVPNSRREYIETLLPRMLAWPVDNPVGFYAAIHEGAWIGWFHLCPSIVNEPRNEPALEIGYRLRRTVWGGGLATEGARALASFAVDELAPAWIDGCTRPDNAASIAVLRKCGLTFLAERIHPRAPIRVVCYRAAPGAVIRGAWRLAAD